MGSGRRAITGRRSRRRTAATRIRPGWGSAATRMRPCRSRAATRTHRRSMPTKPLAHPLFELLQETRHRRRAVALTELISMPVIRCQRRRAAKYRARRVSLGVEVDVCGVLTTEGQCGQCRAAGFGLWLRIGIGRQTRKVQGGGYGFIERRYRHNFLQGSGRDLQLSPVWHWCRNRFLIPQQ